MRQVSREAQKPWLKYKHDQEIFGAYRRFSRSHIPDNLATHAFPWQYRHLRFLLGNIAAWHIGLKPVSRSQPLKRTRALNL